MCEERSLCIGFIVGDNEPATDGWGGCLGLGCNVGITVTAKMQGEGEELKYVCIGRGGMKTAGRERTQEDQLWCD